MRAKRLVAAAALAALVALGTAGCAPTSPTTTCTVDDKDRSSSTDGKSVFRVYTDCGIFNVEDAAFLGQWNSADTYAQIKVGKTYQFTTYGYRNGFLSQYPNITEAVEVKN
jgi:hypothetical protein